MAAGKNRYAKSRGNGLVLTIGLGLVGMGLGVLAVDMPVYYAAQNQLQTAVDAAAIAGAYALPEGYAEAEAAAIEVASENPVGGRQLDASNFEFAYSDAAGMTMKVTGHAYVSTVFGKFLCALGSDGGEFQGEEGGGESGPDNCETMAIYADAEAVPAARDTVMVIDTSSSMGYGDQPVDRVKIAAEGFVDKVDAFANQTGNVDRISVVTFDVDSSVRIGLTAEDDYNGNGFHKVKDTIDYYQLYDGYGYNTNYYAGLKAALDELEENGRPNAKHSIIFLTDGYPNLPAPPAYGSPQYAYSKCENMVENSDAVEPACEKKYYKRWGNWYYYWDCPDFPGDWDEKITDAMVEQSGGHDCGVEYTDYMLSRTQAQIDRAEEMGVTIHTIEIFDPTYPSNSLNMLRAFMLEETWDPELLYGFANNTGGEMYASATADEAELDAIYTTIAQDVRVKLSK